MKIDYVVSTDVLIIGGGGAGIKAAIEAAKRDAEVLMVTKRKFGYTGSTFYPGTSGWGMNAIIFPGDTEDFFVQEILEAGAGCADPRLARVLAQDCTRRFHELETYGLEFLKDPKGGYFGVIPCFGKRKRGSATYGIPTIRKKLWKQLMMGSIRVRDHVAILSLVVDHGTCIGAIGIDEMDHIVLFQAKATILATGGACALYQYSLATDDQVGDGYALALAAGCSVVNLEFIQFIPGITWPVKKMLFQEKNLDTLPTMTNRLGESVLADYLPPNVGIEECLVERAKHGPFSTTTCSRYFDIAMYEQWRKGLALDSGGLHMHYSPSVLKDERWVITKWLEFMQSRGINVVQDGFDMVPHAQGFNGGVRIDAQCRTEVAGLYAAGEVAGGPHGADRLGGAAIAATQVFGAIAGEQAALWAASHSQGVIEHCEAGSLLEQRLHTQQGGRVDIMAYETELRSLMWTCGAIVRSAERCEKALLRIQEMQREFNPAVYFPDDPHMREAAQLHGSLTVASVLLAIMNERKESRGPHYRLDYPKADESMAGMLQTRLGPDGLTFKIIKGF
jgi:fumarate reductase (CoM/CoB) subunit A